MRDTPMWRRYLRFLGKDPAADVEDEIDFHFSMRVEDLMRGGMSEREARERAEREFGDVRRVRSELTEIGRTRQRRERRARGWESVMQDLRFAGRTLRKSPGFTAVAVLTLAVGIGASTAMFTLVNTVLLRPLEYRDPDRLVAISERPPEGESGNPTSPANYFDWKEQSTTLADVAASASGPANLTGDGVAEQILVRRTTGNFFTVLGVGAAHGRTYLDGDEEENFVVLSHDLWRRRYAGDPALVGKNIELYGQSLQVIGVMPATFRSVGTRPDAWIPVPFDPDWRGRYLEVVGRLRPGVSMDEARSELATIGSRLAIAYPEFNRDWSVDLVPMHERVTGDARPALLVLLGAVALLLLIACANVANLLLSRAVARRREIAVRLSLGATRGRLIRQTLTESLVLAGIAGVLGLALATWGTYLLVRVLPTDLALPRLDEIRVDRTVLSFGLGVSLLTGILFGIAPALFGPAVNLASTLREAMRGTSSGKSAMRRALVVVEVALAVVLLVGAGLLGRSLQSLMAVDPGVRTEGVLTLQVTLSGERYGEDEAVRGFMDELLQRLDAIPGARSVGAETYLPLTGAKMGHAFWRGELPRPGPGEELPTDIRVVAGDYFVSMGIPLRSGRAFDARDHADAPTAFVVNEELARRYYPDENPVGKPLAFEWGEEVTGEIVGVVGSVHEMGPAEPAAPAIYRAFAQMPSHEMAVVVRTDGDPMALAAAAAAAVRAIDPNQPVARVRTMEQVAADAVARPRFNLLLLGGFAGVALLLAGLGLYGIVSYSVTQRRHEIGVRVALGAGRGHVLRLIVRQGMGLTAMGLLIGIAAALAATRVMASLLYGISATDPVTLMGVVVFLAAVSLLASYLPGRRATRVDPAIALRAE